MRDAHAEVLSPIEGLSKDEERFTRRLEAFSDIVIGFSLAQLSGALTVGNLTNPLHLLFFLVPFAVVCSLWFFHHRLFSQVFVPKTWPVLINFMWLAAVVLVVFVAAAYTRGQTLLLTRYYFASYALVYSLLVVQYVLALRYADARHNAVARLRALRGSWFMFLWTLPVLFALIVVLVFSPGAVYMLISLGFVIAGFISSGMKKRFDAAEAKLRAA